MPHEPLARIRLLSVWFAATIAFLNIGLLFFDSLPMPFGWIAVGAAVLLGLWWLYGYHRGGFPAFGWLVDVVLMVLVTVRSPMPMHAIGVFFAGVQFRALFVSRRELPVLAVSYAAARLASIGFGPLDPALLPFSGISLFQITGLTLIAVALYLFADATRRHAEIERALQRSDERHQLLARSMRDVVYDWNVPAGTIEWTESMQNVFGFAPETVCNKIDWWVSLVHPDDYEALGRAVNAAFNDPTVDVDTLRYRVRRADDSYAHVSGTMIIQRDASGAPNRVIGSIRDVTTEQQLEEQLRQSQKMEAVGKLAGGVAHDFNNLLTVIGGHVFMLEQHVPSTEATDKHLAGITRAADRAALLTKQLLAFSRKQLLTPSVVDLNAVVDDVIQMMRPVIGEHLQIVTRLDPLLSPAFADAGQLEQVLVNLALNARDAMPGGGTLTVETGNTTLDLRADDAAAGPLPAGDYVRLSMRDTGTGMDAETLARAFEPFFTTKAKGQGSGLGLATVYGIVKQSFGDIQATSTPGAGSTFTILLPVAHRPVVLPDSGVPSVAVPETSMPRQRNLLLVEDDDGVRDFARIVLARAGYHVQSARNGVDALEQMRAATSPIDVVVTDVVMPEMSGPELVEQLRQQHPDLPVLYITGYTDDSRMVGGLYATDARVLEKPFTANALKVAVEEVSESRSRHAAFAQETT